MVWVFHLFLLLWRLPCGLVQPGLFFWKIRAQRASSTLGAPIPPVHTLCTLHTAYALHDARNPN